MILESSKTTQIKIAFFSALPPFRGGISSFSRFLVNALKGKSLIEAFTFKKQYPNFLFPGESQFSKGKEVSFPRIITSYNPFTYFKAGRKLKQAKPDVFVVNYWMPFFAPMYAFLASRFSNSVFKVALIHNLTPHEERFFDRFLNRMFLKNFDAFVVLSEKVNQDLLSYRPNAISKVIPHPAYNQFGSKKDFQHAREYFKIDKDAKVLLFFGLIRDYKGLDILIEAMNFLDERYVLLIAGEIYGDKKKYLKAIEAIKKGEVILHDHFIADENVANYFSAADCCVLPYKSGTQSGIQAIASSFELPVVVSKNGGLHESITDGKNGFVIEELTPKSLSEKIQNVFSGGKLQVVKEGLLIQNNSKLDEWSCFADDFMHFISTEKSKK
ncbi:MAG: glycosyl transferase [Cryomorphaceae bacterium]|nr:glycosyl transferase [Cryomorphaceae bacterium]